MTRLPVHVRNNLVAYVALFVALGGTSYAAFSLPANSVGAHQIRDHSITPVKFDPSAIGGSVRYWARISASGRVIDSRPRAHIVGWSAGPTAIYVGGIINWGRPIAAGCFSVATVESYPSAGYASAVAVNGNGGLGTQVRVALSSPNPVSVAVICPEP